MKRLAIAMTFLMLTASVSEVIGAGGQLRSSQRRMRKSLDSWKKKASNEWKNHGANSDQVIEEIGINPPKPAHRFDSGGE